MISIAISNIRKDLLGQPLQLLSGVDILGNASSALGHMSKGMAALSMDKKFIQSRQKQVRPSKKKKKKKFLSMSFCLSLVIFLVIRWKVQIFKITY